MSGDSDVIAVQQPTRSTTTAATVPRKRRKRTTTGGGAADDCFTCANAGSKCDRRRPYCSQCLDHGRSCAGYKTTLTWGMGVASRGKLRGQTLPVSDGIQSISTISSFKPDKQSTVSSGTSVKTSLSSEQSRRKKSTTKSPPVATVPSKGSNSLSEGNNKQSNPTLDAAEDVFLPENHDHKIRNSGSFSTLRFPHSQTHELPPNSTGVPNTSSGAPSLTTTKTWIVPSTAPSISTYPAVSNSNPNNHGDLDSYSQSEISTWPTVVTGKRRASSIAEDDIELKEETLDSTEYSKQFPVIPYHQEKFPWQVYASPFAGSLPDILLEQSVGRTPRMRYLISYFAEVIAPVIVAFDRPSNPYRTRILQLAHHSDTLQHAIAALSASNIRQRREEKILSTERTEQARKSSIAHRALTDVSFQERHGIQDFGSDHREEVYHKSVAIKSLNTLLADPTKRHHDSVLASLLVLCLFHICKTGVAQFQTQFAGVRKLLAMRHRMNIAESEEARWCTRMFTWFDAMTATINNREGQLQGLYLDMTCLSDEEWALENLAGCDGRLFKIIARLGRLNILSQNQPVDPSYNIETPVAMPTVPPALSHYTPNGMNATYAATLYANPQLTQSENAGFWTEWHSIRQQLESWRLDAALLASSYDMSNPPHSPNSYGSLSPTTVPVMSPPTTPNSSAAAVSPSNLADLSNISEAFRYSALLYTERLAHPDIPSTHPRIQTFVLTAMHYIAAVQSDVYLLWPLFITGSECVYEEHRTAIRNRCKDIQKDSGFYNNISCLELLEKIWSQNPAVRTQQQQDQQQNLSVPYNNNRHQLQPQQQSRNIYPTNGYSGSPVSNMRTQTQRILPSSSSVPKGNIQSSTGFRWRSIIEGEEVDGEYIVV